MLAQSLAGGECSFSGHVSDRPQSKRRNRVQRVFYLQNLMVSYPTNSHNLTFRYSFGYVFKIPHLVSCFHHSKILR